jgi:hypothetical protein
MTKAFEVGDFVRLKASTTGRVGVISHIDPDRKASMQVYWHKSEQQRVTDVHEPRDLLVVSSDEAPEYAIALKKGLGL